MFVPGGHGFMIRGFGNRWVRRYCLKFFEGGRLRNPVMGGRCTGSEDPEGFLALCCGSKNFVYLCYKEEFV